jgi:hypothetical protein
MLAAMPAVIEMRPPQISREKMSRPRPSVPRMWPSAPGGRKRFKMSPRFGSAIGSHGARIAATIRTMIGIKEIASTG